MLRDLVKICSASATNAGPLSLWIVDGRLNGYDLPLENFGYLSTLFCLGREGFDPPRVCTYYH